MAEGENSETNPNPNIQYTEVKHWQTSPEIQKNSVVISLSEVQYLTPKSLDEHRLALIELRAEKEKVEPNERIKAALEIGKSMILDYLGANSEANRKRMKVIFTPPEKHSSIYPKKEYVGVMVPGVDSVITELDNGDYDFSNASNAFHELIHRWVDRQDHVFTIEDNKKYYERKSSFENRRVGVEVDKVIRDPRTGEVTGKTRTGKFINELGNYTWQSVFIKTILNNTELRQVFKDEIKQRNETLRRIYGSDEPGTVFINFTAEEGGSYSIYMNKDNLCLSRKPENGLTTASVIMQLSDEFKSVLGNIEGLDFFSWLINIKSKPELQNKLQSAFEKKLGKGFYQRLKNVNMEKQSEVLNLLQEVQKKTKADQRYGRDEFIRSLMKPFVRFKR